MRDTLAVSMYKTREAVVQIMSWCIIIAAHDVQGLGGQRLECLAEAIVPIQEDYVRLVDRHGPQRALQIMVEGVSAYCSAEMRVPLNRAPRTARERQLRIAGDTAAQIAWCVFARGIHELYGFGRVRLDRIRDEATENYRQFAAWDAEDHEWALDRLRRCAENALGVPMQVQNTEQPNQPAKATMHQADIRAIAAEAMEQISNRVRPAGWALMSTEEQNRRAGRIAEAVERGDPSTRFY